MLSLLQSARLEGVTLDTESLEFAYHQSLERAAEVFSTEPSLTNLEAFYEAASVLMHLPFYVDLWKVQNYFYELLQRQHARQLALPPSGDEPAQRWIARFQSLAQLLRIKVPEEAPQRAV